MTDSIQTSRDISSAVMQQPAAKSKSKPKGTRPNLFRRIYNYVMDAAIVNRVMDVVEGLWNPQFGTLLTCATTQFSLPGRWYSVTKRGKNNEGVELSRCNSPNSSLTMIVTAEKLNDRSRFQSTRALKKRLRDGLHGDMKEYTFTAKRNSETTEVRNDYGKVKEAFGYYRTKPVSPETTPNAYIFVGEGPDEWQWQVEFLDTNGRVYRHRSVIENIMYKNFAVLARPSLWHSDTRAFTSQ